MLPGQGKLLQLGAAKEAVTFLVIATGLSAGLYYLPDYFWLEQATAAHSAWLLNLIGIDGTAWTSGSRAFVNEFWIARECTGVQVVAVFTGIILALPTVAWRKRILAILAVTGSVYLANILRIALEIWLLYNGILPWELAHYPTGLALGVVSVTFLVIVADFFIPQIGDYIFTQLDRVLPKKSTR
jgi:exosortase/archaeosortase family protein